MTCIHCGAPARFEFLAYPPSYGLDARWEPVCVDCADPHRYLRDLCDCDEGRVCDYHRAEGYTACPHCDSGTVRTERHRHGREVRWCASCERDFPGRVLR